MIFVVAAAVGLLAYSIADRGNEAKALPNCEVPVLSADKPVFEEVKSFYDPSRDLISEAEEYVCHELRFPDEIRGWALQGIDAFRLHLPTGYSWRAHLLYTLDTYGASEARYLSLVVMGANQPPDTRLERKAETISIHGRPAQLSRSASNPGAIQIRWQRDGLSFLAILGTEAGAQEIRLHDLIAFLSSIH